MASESGGGNAGELAKNLHNDAHSLGYVVPIQTVPIKINALDEETMGTLFLSLAYNYVCQHSGSG